MKLKKSPIYRSNLLVFMEMSLSIRLFDRSDRNKTFLICAEYVIVELKESAVAVKASTSMHNDVHLVLENTKQEKKMAKRETMILCALQKNMVNIQTFDVQCLSCFF